MGFFQFTSLEAVPIWSIYTQMKSRLTWKQPKLHKNVKLFPHCIQYVNTFWLELGFNYICTFPMRLQPTFLFNINLYIHIGLKKAIEKTVFISIGKPIDFHWVRDIANYCHCATQLSRLHGLGGSIDMYCICTAYIFKKKNIFKM